MVLKWCWHFRCAPPNSCHASELASPAGHSRGFAPLCHAHRFEFTWHQSLASFAGVLALVTSLLVIRGCELYSALVLLLIAQGWLVLMCWILRNGTPSSSASSCASRPPLHRSGHLRPGVLSRCGSSDHLYAILGGIDLAAPISTDLACHGHGFQLLGGMTPICMPF